MRSIFLFDSYQTKIDKQHEVVQKKREEYLREQEKLEELYEKQLEYS